MTQASARCTIAAMDLIAFGGPAGPCYASKVEWKRPTTIIGVGAGTAKNTSTDQFAVYQSLSLRDGFAWKAMCERGKVAPEELGSLGIAGFSAFHGFANAFLKNPQDFDRCCYVHLADACFLGAGATEPHQGYAAFAKQAALGQGGKLMVATTNGPWGKDLHYSWDYPDGRVNFDLTSGAKCFELVWNAAVDAGMAVSDPEVPAGVPVPTKRFRVGNLIWCHYETMTPGLPTPCGGEYSQHGWHCVALATPYMQHYGAPWMAGERAGLGGLVGAPWVKPALAIATAGLVAWVVGHYLRRSGRFARNCACAYRQA